MVSVHIYSGSDGVNRYDDTIYLMLQKQAQAKVLQAEHDQQRNTSTISREREHAAEPLSDDKQRVPESDPALNDGAAPSMYTAPEQSEFVMGPDKLKELNFLLGKYVGTHNFHNFTVQVGVAVCDVLWGFWRP